MKNTKRQARVIQAYTSRPVILPDEILLHEIFPRFPLQSLIAARGVTKQWRYLVPFANLLPARRALLELYYFIIKSPSFLASRSYIYKQLRKFDRPFYLSLLQLLVVDNPGCFLPEEIRLWILEWPSAAAFLWTWPGLSERPWYRAGMRRFWRRVRVKNSFHDGFPALSGIFVAHPEHPATELQMIELWEHPGAIRSADWLVLDLTADADGCTHFGEVFHCNGSRTDKRIALSWSEWVKFRVEQEDHRGRRGEEPP
ncbi:hypothetical protein BV22DRAFT_87545 [Leucogyrophana mollusca]|uniref:Uncharacterized protein n=1 Tax=Leucogyrophana mollusca TaxID=85980 RepID=A0ACB8BWK4_9AGAM|nr:hypothetical protein BV22DRAFT_87545 [Leucogyrophana mollusca]